MTLSPVIDVGATPGRSVEWQPTGRTKDVGLRPDWSVAGTKMDRYNKATDPDHKTTSSLS